MEHGVEHGTGRGSEPEESTERRMAWSTEQRTEWRMARSTEPDVRPTATWPVHTAPHACLPPSLVLVFSSERLPGPL